MARRAKSSPVPSVSEHDVVDAADNLIRTAASGLKLAIEMARADGFVIQMPFRVEDLDRIVISATARATPTT